MADDIQWSGASIRRTDDGEPLVSIPFSGQWVDRDVRAWNAVTEALDAILPNMVVGELIFTIDRVHAILYVGSPDLYACSAPDLRAAVENAAQTAEDVLRAERAEDDTIGRDWVTQLYG